MKPKREITALIEIEDDDFLSQVAKAEANALSGSDSTKRRKFTAVDSNIKNDDDQEGDYIAALRGSKSASWQQRVKAMSSTSSDYNRSGGNRSAGMVVGSGGSDPLVSEKMCPCGLGACNVFTANTERNRGRSFYKCPQRQENGGCGFFQWCDSDGSATINTYTAGGSGGPGYGTTNSMLLPDLPCPCGAGSCLILTAKIGNNIGKQFYKCPANQGSSCSFFKWCNDDTAPAGVPPSASEIYYKTIDSKNKSYAVETGSSCFKCGKEGHWAKDCSASSSNSPAAFGSRPGLSGACYKCGKPGHWARDCTSSQYMHVRQQY